MKTLGSYGAPVACQAFGFPPVIKAYFGRIQMAYEATADTFPRNSATKVPHCVAAPQLHAPSKGAMRITEIASMVATLTGALVNMMR